MKFNTLNRFPYTVEVWVAESSTDGAGNVTTTLTFDRKINVRISPDGTGRTFFYTNDADLKKGDHLLRLKGADGTSIDGKEYAVTLQEPVLSVFGTREYYRYWGLEAD